MQYDNTPHAIATIEVLGQTPIFSKALKTMGKGEEICPIAWGNYFYF
jgi:hypothetical protein